VGIEVISAVHPWPQIRAYFRVHKSRPGLQQESPKLSLASPAPAKLLVAA
jgi:hypothetical protein